MTKNQTEAYYSLIIRCYRKLYQYNISMNNIFLNTIGIKWASFSKQLSTDTKNMSRQQNSNEYVKFFARSNLDFIEKIYPIYIDNI